MSDPVTNVEIEDVLSSIRRLVSIEDTPRKAPDLPTAKAGPLDADGTADEKLVLTAAQRIPDASDNSSDNSVGQGDDVLTEDTVAPPDNLLQAADVASENFEEETSATSGLASATLSEVEGLATRLTDISDAAAKEAVLVEIRKVLFQRANAQDASSQDAVPDVTPDFVETPNYGPEALPSAIVQPVVEEPRAGSVPLRLVDRLEEPVAEEPPVSEAPFVEVDEAGQIAATPSVSLEDKIAELEAMISQSPEDWEPEAEDDSGNPAAPSVAEVAIPWNDAVSEVVSQPSIRQVEDAQVIPPEPADEGQAAALDAQEASTPVEDAAQVRDANANKDTESSDDDTRRSEAWPPLRAVPDPQDDMIMDEDSLRKMVVSIVREELQGNLGERITRNVRKLVRREIQRALMNRDLE